MMTDQETLKLVRHFRRGLITSDDLVRELLKDMITSPAAKVTIHVTRRTDCDGDVWLYPATPIDGDLFKAAFGYPSISAWDVLDGTHDGILRRVDLIYR